MPPTLVILAAGLGSRFGGLKQLEAVGPGGAAIMDYTVYDAWRAGFGRVVFVIREEMRAAFGEMIGRRFGGRLPAECVVQRMDDPDFGATPAGRTRPWGTGHAVLSAAQVVHEPLAVVNADDFYGARGIAAVAEFLGQTPPAGPPVHAMVGYRLRDTLAESGAVARALCECTPDGWLERIVETRGIERLGDDACRQDEHGQRQIISGDRLVSMNLWAFQPAIFDELRAGFAAFRQASGDSLDAEFHLPAGVQSAMAAGRARVRVLPGGGGWCGMTHRGDHAHVARTIADMIARGDYPAELWT
ncbi:MAG: NTP transferase domain-containing protein [Phycisphaerae bacterium]|jgi:hypothetical protein